MSTTGRRIRVVQSQSTYQLHARAVNEVAPPLPQADEGNQNTVNSAGTKNKMEVKTLLFLCLVLSVIMLLIAMAVLQSLAMYYILKIENQQQSTTSSSKDILQHLKAIQNSLNLVLMNLINSTTLNSCEEIKSAFPDSTSGYYALSNNTQVFCEMGELCGDTEGGWTRLAFLDMSDSDSNCPTGFNSYGQVRACGRNTRISAGCTSVTFPSNGISYSEVCGRVTGYQFGTTDGFDGIRFVTPDMHNDINQHYIDGVSITKGFPRQHVWSLASGYSDTVATYENCPCTNPPGSVQDIQSFVGDDYFCESGNHFSLATETLYLSDPLWDGEGCGALESNCCSAPGLPWFYKYFNSTTTDYLELRVCGDEGPSNEDTPISYYAIYVK